MVGEDYRGMNEAYRKARTARTQWPRRRRRSVWAHLFWYAVGPLLLLCLALMWALQLTQ